MPRTSKQFFSWHFTMKISHTSFVFTLRTTCPLPATHYFWLNHHRRRVQIVKLIIMQCSPFYYFHSLWSIYSPQHFFNSTLRGEG
jgi:hypothetical protein